jgi:hypothetical protein
MSSSDNYDSSRSSWNDEYSGGNLSSRRSGYNDFDNDDYDDNSRSSRSEERGRSRDW